MKLPLIKRYSKDECTSFGFYDEDEIAIYIRDDMKRTDYIEVLIHEFIHYIIHLLTLNNEALRIKLHCFYDVADSIVWGWNIKAAEDYIKEYSIRLNEYYNWK